MSKADRWNGIERNYSPADVERLRGSVNIEHTLARLGAERLWELMKQKPYIHALGAMTGGQAVQMVRAGLQSVYVSGWQCAADANLSGHTFPDQSLYPANSVPALVKRINNALQRADQIEHSEGGTKQHWFAPIVADAEAGFGGPLNAYELMKAMIEAGAAAVHFEDQLASEKKCGHLGGKVLVPTAQFIRTLTAARLAADVMDVPTVLIARTDADSAKLITSDIDPRDHDFILSEKTASGQRTPEGYFRLARTGMERCVARGLAYAPYADLLWFETSTPDLMQAKDFADAIHMEFPEKLLAYNCSPSFIGWSRMSRHDVEKFQRELGSFGFAYQFVTLAGWHALNSVTFELADGYRDRGMGAYADLQIHELAQQDRGYMAVKHQREVGTEYFSEISRIISSDMCSTLPVEGSTEKEQFDAYHNSKHR